MAMRNTDAAILQDFSPRDQAVIRVSKNKTGRGRTMQLILQSAYYANGRKARSEEVSK